MKFIVRIVISFMALLLSVASIAQTYPNKPVRVIVPFATGGPTDAMARILAQKLTESMGQSFVVENRAGAGGNIGMGMGAKAAPDGYTVLYTVTGTTSQLPHLYAKSPVDPFNDFTPLGLFAFNQLVLTIPPSLPAKTVKELVEYARANPGKMNYASFGNGSFPHIVSELLKANTGIEMTHVPFKGGADAGSSETEVTRKRSPAAVR